MDIFKYVHSNLDVSCLTLALWHKQQGPALSEETSAAVSVRPGMNPHCPLEAEMSHFRQEKDAKSSGEVFV